MRSCVLGDRVSPHFGSGDWPKPLQRWSPPIGRGRSSLKIPSREPMSEFAAATIQPSSSIYATRRTLSHSKHPRRSHWRLRARSSPPSRRAVTPLCCRRSAAMKLEQDLARDQERGCRETDHDALQRRVLTVNGLCARYGVAGSVRTRRRTSVIARRRFLVDGHPSRHPYRLPEALPHLPRPRAHHVLQLAPHARIARIRKQVLHLLGVVREVIHLARA